MKHSGTTAGSGSLTQLKYKIVRPKFYFKTLSLNKVKKIIDFTINKRLRLLLFTIQNISNTDKPAYFFKFKTLFPFSLVNSVSGKKKITDAYKSVKIIIHTNIIFYRNKIVSRL